MDQNNQQPFSNYTVLESKQHTGAVAKTFFARVFLWMFAALAISTFSAFLFASTPSLMAYLINETGRGLSGLGYITMFAPIGFVLAMSAGFSRFSSSVLILLFMLYAAVTGISLSFILLAYTSGSVMGCFASAAGMFGIMAIMGYTTTQDLTSFGRIMMMGVIGIIISGIINMFLHSSGLEYIISIVGVLAFTGLTAYDVQVLKRIGAGMEYEGTSAEDTQKTAIMGALRLYLDFINLFLMLLRLFGRRK
ncbi:MAG: Bax inhibitor-1/YccA family protein [Bacteroidota bacterium]